MDNYMQVYCFKCDENYVSYSYNKEIDDDHKYCSKCGGKNIINKFKDISNENVILQIVEEELENANYHSLTSLPSELFNTIKDSLQVNQYPEVARKIAMTFYESI